MLTNSVDAHFSLIANIGLLGRESEYIGKERRRENGKRESYFIRLGRRFVRVKVE